MYQDSIMMCRVRPSEKAYYNQYCGLTEKGPGLICQGSFPVQVGSSVLKGTTYDDFFLPR